MCYIVHKEDNRIHTLFQQSQFYIRIDVRTVNNEKTASVETYQSSIGFSATITGMIFNNGLTSISTVPYENIGIMVANMPPVPLPCVRYMIILPPMHSNRKLIFSPAPNE